jgi:uncharacterized protein YceH (UPF0502 family)
MDTELTPHEMRVIGSLIEKQVSTPEQYPLSLNALVNACNQKSNRDPVLELDEATVQAVVDGLAARYLVTEQRGYGSRVSKYEQRFCNTSFGKLQFSPEELGIVCELLLRGPQTPGELRSRASRLCRLNDVAQVEEILLGLASRPDGPFVVRLAREPGRRESRYAHLFGGEPVGQAETELESASRASPATLRQPDRLDELERRVAELEAEVAALKSRLASQPG